ncbi:MAG: hypothetical protein ABIL00_06445 [candidate division WOR-3 bacterium]
MGGGTGRGREKKTRRGIGRERGEGIGGKSGEERQGVIREGTGKRTGLFYPPGMP